MPSRQTFKLVPLEGGTGTQLIDGSRARAVRMASEIARDEHAAVMVFDNATGRAVCLIEAPLPCGHALGTSDVGGGRECVYCGTPT